MIGTSSSDHLSLHDELALGGFLQSTTTSSSGVADEVGVGRPSDDEVRRLPLLLRLLSSARPLSSVPSFAPIGGGDDGMLDNHCDDVVIQKAVDRLEDRAAMYAEAEGVEYVVCQLAPRVTRKLSKLPPLLSTTTTTTTTTIKPSSSIAGGSEKQQQQTTPTTASKTKLSPPASQQQNIVTATVKGGGGGGSSSLSAATARKRAWHTDELEIAASNPLGRRTSTLTAGGGPRKKRKVDAGGTAVPVAGQEYSEEDDYLSDYDQDEKEKQLTSPGGGRSANNNSILGGASGDSQVATVSKTMSELAQLVVRSLKTYNDTGTTTTTDTDDGVPLKEMTATNKSNNDQKIQSKIDGGKDSSNNGKKKGNPMATAGGAVKSPSDPSPLPVSAATDVFSIPLHDSMLMEEASSSSSSSSSGTGGAGAGGVGAIFGSCDLPLTVASLMFHVPVLRHSHVATALCRAGVPQIVELIAAMGANCPISVPCLLRGCVDAYVRSTTTTRGLLSPLSPVAVAARNAIVHALGSLSEREACRIRTMLSFQGNDLAADVDATGLLLHDAQLELATRSNHEEAALETSCLVVQYLSQDVDAGDGLTLSTSPKKKSLCLLLQHLTSNPTALEKTFESIIRDLQEARCQQKDHAEHTNKDAALVLWSRACIPLAALGFLFYRVVLSMDTQQLIRIMTKMNEKNEEKGSADGGRRLATATIILGKILSELQVWSSLLKDSIQKLADKQEVDGESSQPPMHCPALDRVYSLAVCVSFLALASTCIADTVEDDDTDTASVISKCRDTCGTILTGLLQGPVPSFASSAMAARFVAAVKRNHAEPSIDRILGILLQPATAKASAGGSCEAVPVHLSKACEWASRNCDLDALLLRGTEKRAFVAAPAVGLELVRDVGIQEENNRIGRVEELLKVVLESSEHSTGFLKSSVIPPFVEGAVAALLQRRRSVAAPAIIPLVHSLQIENMSRTLSIGIVDNLTADESRFILCLLYCFSFKEEVELSGTSPFVFDPRELPLCKVRSLCETLPLSVMSQSIRSRLVEYIDRYCPEVTVEAKLLHALRSSRQNETKDRTACLGSFRRILKTSLEQPDSDPSGSFAEKSFLQAREKLSEASLFTATASLLMSEPASASPPRYYTYYALCRDPLLLLKCPISIWKRKGHRRIVLLVLSRLLEVNDYVVTQEAPSSESRKEFLDSRNAILVRSLLTALAPLPSGSLGSSLRPLCSMSLALIRKTIANNRGIFAMVLKQGIPESALDCAVEWIPECIEDSHALGSIISERSSLTTADRLVAADGVLRIALAHGHRVPEEAKTLVFSALSQLLASFFLILGPVGVPVNTLVGDGTGADATHVSRKAAFRMLKALTNVQSYMSQLRSECVIALQKLGGLIKGESIVGNVSGAAGNRQKTVVKELLEAVVRAANAMGSGILIS